MRWRSMGPTTSRAAPSWVHVCQQHNEPVDRAVARIRDHALCVDAPVYDQSKRLGCTFLCTSMLE